MSALAPLLATATGPGDGAVLPLAFIAVFAVVALAAFVRDRRRRKKRDAYAAEQGWELVDKQQATRELMPLLPTSSGSFRERVTWAARVPYEGEGDCVVCDYRYSYRSGSGRNRKTKTQRKAAAVVFAAAPLPALELRRKGLFGAIREALSSRAIEVESADFNKRFLVLAKDQQAAVAVLDARTQERLLALDPEDVQVKWRSIVVVDKAQRAGGDTPQHATLLEVCEAVEEGVPDWVRHDLSEESLAPDWDTKELDPA